MDAEVKGLILRRASSKDQICLKVVYVLDGKNKGFIVLSEKKMPLSDVL